MNFSNPLIKLLLFQSVPYGAIVGCCKIQHNVAHFYKKYKNDNDRFLSKFIWWSSVGAGGVIVSAIGGMVAALPGGMYFGALRFWNFYQTGDKGWIKPLSKPMSWDRSPIEYLFYPNGPNS